MQASPPLREPGITTSPRHTIEFLEAQTLDLAVGACYTSFKFMNVLQEIAPHACL